MPDVWVYITYGLQDKEPFMHPGMGDFQTFMGEDHFFEKDNIEGPAPGDRNECRPVFCRRLAGWIEGYPAG